MVGSVARSVQVVAGSQVDVIPRASSGPLVHGVHLAAGVQADVDLTVPHRWCAVVRPRSDPSADPVLLALLGDEPGEMRSEHAASRAPMRLPASAGPWLRVAVVDALDRWLQAPLQQSLVDAERGVTRGRAARTLSHGPARAVLTVDALRLARRSSHDLVAFLRKLGRGPRPVPRGLLDAVKNLVDGYAELVDEVAGPDRELMSVLDGWRRLGRRLGTPSRPAAVDPTAGPQSDPSSAAGALHRLAHAVSTIDPRQVGARVLALSADPASAEVSVSAAGDDSVVVRVPAFGPTVDPDLAARLLARLVDRRSAKPQAHALLRTSDDAACFEAVLPLWGMHLSDVRADVADALSDVPPAADDADDGLCEARRAAVFLAEWRRLVGLAQLGVTTAAPACHLRRLATRLHLGRGPADAPLFTGGPSGAELESLADVPDDDLLRRLRGDGPLGEGLRVLTAGPAALLVAELAALFSSS